MVSEQRVLLFSDLHRATTILQNRQQLSLPTPDKLLRINQCVSYWRAYLRYQDLVASCDAHAYPLAFFVEAAGSDSKDLGLIELLDTALGQKDTGCRLGIGLDALNQDAIEKRREGANRLEGGSLQQSAGYIGKT